MEKANGTPIYWLGNSLGHLMAFIGTGQPIPMVINVANSALLNLSVFLNIAGLPLSRIAAQDIANNIRQFISSHTLVGNVSSANPISEQEKSVLIGSILHFQSVLSSELPQINIFYVPPHRAYDMTMLINTGQNLLSPLTLKLLGASREEVIKDIQEAASCLAFDFSTAVGFHLYRAIEAIIVRDFFDVLKISSDERKSRKNLGQYIALLQNKGVDVKIKNMLTHIKDRYRNPIMHPEEFWDSEKANSAIGPAISVIDMMVQEIEEIKKKAMT
jgi:hypothetical protein